MNSVQTLGLVLLVLVLGSISLMYFIMDSYGYLYTSEKLEKEFYSSKFDSSKKLIVILGSSQIQRLNMTFINHEISKICSECVVFNLGKGADNPSKRLSTIHFLKKLNPEIVIYGIGYRDFANLANLDEKNSPVKSPESILPNPKNFFYERFLFNYFNQDINPKLVSLNFIQNVKNTNEPIKNDYSNPNIIQFRKNFDKSTFLVFDNVELQEKKIRFTQAVNLAKIDPTSFQKNFKALKQFATNFQNEESKFVVFITPHPQVFLDLVSDSDKDFFTSSLDTLSSEFNIPIYSLNSSLSHMKIWSDYWHITLDSNGIIFSQEVANIIKNELG